MEVRKMELKDVEQVVDINMTDWKKTYRGIISDDFLDSLSREHKINRTIQMYDNEPYIVVEDDGKILGFCRYGDYNAIKFYEKMGGKIVDEIYKKIGGRKYKEVGFEYDIK